MKKPKPPDKLSANVFWVRRTYFPKLTWEECVNCGYIIKYENMWKAELDEVVRIGGVYKFLILFICMDCASSSEEALDLFEDYYAEKYCKPPDRSSQF